MTPTSIDYGTVAPPFTAGRFGADPAGYSAYLDEIAAQAGNSWVKCNAVTGGAYTDAWLPADLRDPFGTPFATLNAWPSGDQDTKRHQFVVWGGGHGDSNDNAPYAFDFLSGKWKNLYLPSLHARGQSNEYLGYSVDGIRSPESTHAYNSNVYLRVLDRLWVRGGATQPGGDPLRVWDESSPRQVLRLAGSYSLALDRGGLGFVAGETGAHGHAGAYASVNYWGAHAWTLHDWLAPTASYSALAGEWYALNSGAVATVEGGRDVVYFTTHSVNSEIRRVHRVEFVDGNWRNDVITRVSDWTNDPAQGRGLLALDTAKQLLLMPVLHVNPNDSNDRTTKLLFVDLKRTHGLTNVWYVLEMTDLAGGQAVTDLEAAMKDYHPLGGGDNFGVTYDPNVGQFVLVNGDGAVFYIAAPSGDPTPTTGWTVTKPAITGNGGMSSSAGPLMGKCRWAADLGCTIAIRDSTAGDVWRYKPSEWVRPTGF